MMNAVMQLYPNAVVRYDFFNRGKTEFPKDFDKLLKYEVQDMRNWPLLEQREKNWLKKNCPFLPDTYIDLLAGYHFDPNEVNISQDNGELKIYIVGPWYKTILWEVPLMALISELYFKEIGCVPNPDYINVAAKKGKELEEIGAYFADFGTRRRFSFVVHSHVVKKLKEFKTFVGTSNVYLAMKNDIKPIGTEAHEFQQFHAAKYGYRIANSITLGKWIDVYHGDLGIALTDTFTTDDFFKSFDMMYAKLFDGLRHDSGDPVTFTKKAIKHYESLGIDPITKTIIFSDGLNVKEVKTIHEFCKGKIKDAYGIGTNLSNDVGAEPLNIVIKMTAAKPEGKGKWIQTCKLSDIPGKHTGDPNAIKLCKEVLGIQ